MSERLNSLAIRDIEFHVHGQTDLARHREVGPLVIDRGEGVYVYDDQGRQYLEGLAGLWSAGLGFSEPRLAAAAKRQLDRLPFYHTFSHKGHAPVAELAERLVEMAPVPMSKAIFQCSGSEAADTAAKLVWYYHNAIGKPRKKKLIARAQAYHGVTVMAASLTGIPRMHADFDLPLGPVLRAECPHHYKFALPGESEEAFSSRLAASLEDLILREDPETVGAFFAEPIQGAGGVILPPAGYFEKVQAVLRKYDILMVADEVICGFYRTGNAWGSQTYGIAPDILTCAKALSASYLPISALLIGDKIYQALLDESRKLGMFAHGYTYSGHPVPAAVALEALKIYEERDILGHVQRIAPRLQDGLRRFTQHPLVGEVRGVGLIAGLELMQDGPTRTPFPPAAKVGPKLAAFAEARGLIIRAMADVIAVCPPLIISDAQIDELLAKLSAALDDTYAWARAEGHL